MRRLVYTAVARQHVRSAIDWYNDQEPNLGARFVSALRDQARLLEIFPESSPRVDERFRRAQVRGFPYSLFYHVREDTIDVIAVIHTSRHPDRWKKPDQARSS